MLKLTMLAAGLMGAAAIGLPMDMADAQRPKAKSAQARQTAKRIPPVKREVAYYPNCSAARAAGAAPVRRGDPGYSRKLDRDGDGVGCE